MSPQPWSNCTDKHSPFLCCFAIISLATSLRPGKGAPFWHGCSVHPSCPFAITPAAHLPFHLPMPHLTGWACQVPKPARALPAGAMPLHAACPPPSCTAALGWGGEAPPRLHMVDGTTHKNNFDLAANVPHLPGHHRLLGQTHCPPPIAPPRWGGRALSPFILI